MPLIAEEKQPLRIKENNPQFGICSQTDQVGPLQTSASQNLVQGPAASAPPGGLLKMQILGSPADLLN